MIGGLSVVRDAPAFRALLSARTASYLGDFVTLTTLILYLQESGASPALLGIALAARALPQALGPVAGAIVDRIDARRLMIACDLGRLLAIGTVALTLPPFPVLVALMATSAVLSTLFLPAGKSAVPRLVGPDRLAPANALLGMAHNLSLAAGPALAAVLFAAAGPQVAFAVDAASYALSAVLLLRLPTLRSTPDRATGDRTADRHTAGRPAGVLGTALRGVLADTVEGLRFVARHRTARALGVGLFLGVTLAALDNVALVFLLREGLHSGATAVGVASSVYGIAMIVAPVLLLRGGPIAADRYFVAGLAAGGIGLALTGAAPTVVVAVACYAVAGIGNGLENVAGDTLLGQTIRPDLLGRVFGVIYGPIFLAETLAAALGGLLLTVVSPSALLIAAGIGLVVLAAGVRIALPRAGAAASPPA